ncbi:MAG: hypothetical protein MUE73_20100 [Planctomycetes bacterium]|nr:hypothetical protein [Planctomycetota bacterium]
MTGLWLPLLCAVLAIAGLWGCVFGSRRRRRPFAAALVSSLAGLATLGGLWVWEVGGPRPPLPMFARWARGPTEDCMEALAEFRRREGRYPADLGELATKTDWAEPCFESRELSFLFVLPVPELGGAALRYYALPETDGYSVGLRVSGGQTGFAFHLWSYEYLTGPDGPAAAHPEGGPDWQPERRPDIGRFAVFRIE